MNRHGSPRGRALHTRHKGACTNCRQMKLRCDGYERMPQPCTRCDRLRKSCIIDRNFRRTVRRDRINELEKELHELRTTAQKPSSLDEHVTSPQSTQETSSADEHIVQAYAQSSLDLSNMDIVISRYESLLSPQRLEDIELQPREIIEHIVTFYRHYTDIFPILPTFDYLMHNLQSSPFLLWVIVVISSRVLPDRSFLEIELIQPMKRLAGVSIVGGEKPSLFLVQALLLLCQWPLPFKATIEDPSWGYCGAAINIAARIGLHQPANFFQVIYGSKSGEDVVNLRTRAWIACFVMQQQLSLALGLPATVRIDHTILQSLKSNRSSIPERLRQSLRLAYTIHNFSKQLGQYEFSNNGLSPHPLPIVQAFEKDLDILQSELDMENVHVFAAKLHLYSYVLVPYSESSSESPAPMEAKHCTYYVGQAYSCATHIINHFCALLTDSQGLVTPDANLIQCQWTSGQRHCLVYAIMIVLWIYIFSERKDDRVFADAIIQKGRNLMKSLVVMENDNADRVCDIIDYISTANYNTEKNSGTIQKGFSVRSRMSANITWEVLYAVKRRKYAEQITVGGEPVSEMIFPRLDFPGSENFDFESSNDFNFDLSLLYNDWDALLSSGVA